jgi:hypothetical protein
LPMNKLRRRRADRCTFPIEWGSMEKRGSRTGAAPITRGWGGEMEICSDRNKVAKCSNWNILYGQQCKYRDVCIMLLNETNQGG